MIKSLQPHITSESNQATIMISNSSPPPLTEATFHRKMNYIRRRRPLTGVDKVIPLRPVRAMTGYNLFVREYFRRPCPDQTTLVNLKSCAAEWRSLTNLQKLQFSQKCEPDKQRYEREITDWTELRESVTEHPTSPYALFIKDYWANNQANLNHLPFGDIFQQISQQWNNQKMNLMGNAHSQNDSNQNPNLHGHNNQREKNACLPQPKLPQFVQENFIQNQPTIIEPPTNANRLVTSVSDNRICQTSPQLQLHETSSQKVVGTYKSKGSKTYHQNMKAMFNTLQNRGSGNQKFLKIKTLKDLLKNLPRKGLASDTRRGCKIYHQTMKAMFNILQHGGSEDQKFVKMGEERKILRNFLENLPRKRLACELSVLESPEADGSGNENEQPKSKQRKLDIPKNITEIDTKGILKMFDKYEWYSYIS